MKHVFDNYFFTLLKNKSVSCKILTLRQIFSLSLIQILELNFSIGIFKSYFKYKNFKSFDIKFYYPDYSEISQKLISMESLYLLSSRREFDPCLWQFFTIPERFWLKRDSSFPMPSQSTFWNLQHWSKSVTQNSFLNR